MPGVVQVLQEGLDAQRGQGRAVHLAEEELEVAAAFVQERGELFFGLDDRGLTRK
jgi:hypothetical protein